MVIANSAEIPPVLVLGTGITVLGTLRSLRRANIPAFCISSQIGVESYSRFYRRLPLDYLPVLETDNLARALEALPFERAVLMPCSDHWAQKVAALPTDILERYPVSQSSLSTLLLFLDKGRSDAALTRAGVPHPRTISLQSEEDIDIVTDEELPRFFLKPRDSQGFFNRFEVKAFKIRDREDAKALFYEVTRAGYQLILQEYIPGPSSNHYYVEGFVDRHGKVKASFTRQRLRMYPYDFGNSTYMQSVESEPLAAAVDDMHRLLKAVDYRGIYSAEFKKDDRDGLFKLLEVNTRPWWYIEFASLCGVNVAEMAYHDALAEDVAAITSFTIGARSINLYCDLQLWHLEREAGRVGILSWIPDWLCGHYPVFSLTDPLPALMWLFDRSTNKVKKKILPRRPL